MLVSMKASQNAVLSKSAPGASAPVVAGAALAPVVVAVAARDGRRWGGIVVVAARHADHRRHGEDAQQGPWDGAGEPAVPAVVSVHVLLRSRLWLTTDRADRERVRPSVLAADVRGPAPTGAAGTTLPLAVARRDPMAPMEGGVPIVQVRDVFRTFDVDTRRCAPCAAPTSTSRPASSSPSPAVGVRQVDAAVDHRRARGARRRRRRGRRPRCWSCARDPTSGRSCAATRSASSSSSSTCSSR
jgi:hypothetical protein